MHNINLLNTQLNPICHLVALLGAQDILHVSRIRVKSSDNFRKQRKVHELENYLNVSSREWKKTAR
jgi:hypothetical protein